MRYGNVVAHGLDVLSRRNHSGEIQHRRVAEQRARPCGRLAAPIRYLPLHSRVATRLIDALLCAAWRVGPSSAARTRRRRNACAYARARGGGHRSGRSTCGSFPRTPRTCTARTLPDHFRWVMCSNPCSDTLCPRTYAWTTHVAWTASRSRGARHARVARPVTAKVLARRGHRPRTARRRSCGTAAPTMSPPTAARRLARGGGASCVSSGVSSLTFGRRCPN